MKEYAQRQMQKPVNVQLQEVKGDRVRKRKQMQGIFHLLQMGRPMLEYEAIRPLLGVLGVEKQAQRRWSDTSGWNLVDHMMMQVNEKEGGVYPGGLAMAIENLRRSSRMTLARQGRISYVETSEQDDDSDDNLEIECNAKVNTAAGKPDLEAYSGGSWWDVKMILASTYRNQYLKVNYVNFSNDDDEWLPLRHLRMRSRPCAYAQHCCGELYIGMDVSVFTQHPDSEQDNLAWFDAKIIDIQRKRHTSNLCKCSFWVALYEVPVILPRDWRQRKLLPVSPNAEPLSGMTTMREAISMSFKDIIAASLPNVINTSRIWAKDGARWWSSLDQCHTPDSEDAGLFADYLEQVLSHETFSLPGLKRKPTVRKKVPNDRDQITYTELFKSYSLVLDSEDTQGPSPDESESGLLPTWLPWARSMESAVAPAASVPDPLADVWEELRLARLELESGNKAAEPSITLDGEGDNSGGGYCCLEHTVTFDQEIGEVCEECGIIVLGIQDIWTRDNARRIVTAEEGDNDNDEDKYNAEHAVWDMNEDKFEHENNNIEGGPIFELIPDLAKQMQKHQKQGFQFLWRNLGGQDCNGNPCFPRVEPGGCVLSHAPGTGKTFVIISFLQSYMKKYPNSRPVIVAPKIMLQPWEKEFQKWNVDIQVHNFSQAERQRGKAIFQKHMEAGDVQFDRTKKNMLTVYREAMLWEWLKTPSVLIISYQTFNLLTIQVPASGNARMLGIKSILLERPSMVVLDEGHYARNNLSQVKEQLMAIRTPLRVMLSGTLFQNNFEELFTCLNLVRPGFVKTFAMSAGLKLNIAQETVPRQSDVEKERSVTGLKTKAAKTAESQAAKKFFIEEIGNKIDRGQLEKATQECLAQGLQLLRRLTSPFVHHYTGEVLRDKLLPLREFAVVLQPAGLQEKMIKKVAERMLGKNNLEREGSLSLVCIHPSLLAKHSVGKTLTDLLPPEEMMQAALEIPEAGVKTRFVMNLLEILQHGEEKEKILIFCLNINPLALLEKMLETRFGWAREQEILHIDGKVTADERQSIIERFNDREGEVRVLLLSTKACGEGVTLTGASRVVFMDVVWNPAVQRQAIHRAFRIGQTKVVHVYSLVIAGSLEEDKYRTMVWKDWKSQTIFCASDEDDAKVKKRNGFWRMKKQCSKDVVLNELERQDATLDQPAFKHVFRHGGLFDDEYGDDPEGEGTDATDWLRGIEGDIDPSHSQDDMDYDTDDTDDDIEDMDDDSNDMDCDIDDGTLDTNT